jgi:putative aminopeptidase FrvX
MWQPYVDVIRTDALGNVIAHKQPTRSGGIPAPAVMLATHMDEIGLMVAQVEENGFLRVVAMGGIDLRQICGKEVTVHGKTAVAGIVQAVPAPFRDDKEPDHIPTWPDLFIDTGLSTEELRQKVQVGDVVTFSPPCKRLHGDRVAGKSFDNRACIVSSLVCLQRLARVSHAVHVHAVATVQEEVGLRGAITSTFSIAPQLAIAIDVGHGDTPGQPEHDTITLGKGPAISLGPNIHRGVRDRLIAVAKQEQIAWQNEILPGHSGTDAWAMQVSQAGVPTAVISLPLRYMHSTVECVDLADIAAIGRLLAHFLADLEPEEVWRWANVSV